MPVRYFTADQANALVPRLESLIRRLQKVRRRILARHPALAEADGKAPSNGGNKVAGEALPDFERFENLINQVNGLGCVLKDIDQGLVDFPHIRDGREVYLCWRLGERRIRFWHEVESGFAGRKPL
jgi:hypothetical protein